MIDDGKHRIRCFRDYILDLANLPTLTGGEIVQLLMWISLAVQDGDGLMYPETAKVPRVPLCARRCWCVAPCPSRVAQLFQYTCYYAFEAYRVWKHGGPADATRLRRIVRVLQALMHRIALMTNESTVFPKQHDLGHIADNLKLLGRFSGYDAGK